MKYFVDSSGNYIGGFDTPTLPEGGIYVPFPPVSSLQTWSGTEWLTPFSQIVSQFDSAVEAHLHNEAVAHGYTNIERACMYAALPNPYQPESESFVRWVGGVWEYCYGELQKVQDGLRAMPTIAAIISELPERRVF